MFIIHPLNRPEKRIIDADCSAYLMGLTNDHKVALVDEQWTWIHNNDHGKLTYEYLLMLVPYCNHDALLHLLDAPDE